MNQGSIALPPKALAASATPGAAYKAKMIGREVARLTPPEERQRLLAEHDALTQKMFAGGLDRAEDRRLTYVRWNLDRLRDADVGEHLDALEDLVAFQERTATQIDRFVRHVQQVQHSASRRR